MLHCQGAVHAADSQAIKLSAVRSVNKAADTAKRR